MWSSLWLLLLGTAVSKANNEPQNAAKLAEEYVLAADFDNNPVAQIQTTQAIQPEAKDGNQIAFVNGNSNPEVHFPRPPDFATVNGDDRNAIIPAESTLIVSQRSVLAVGFLTFLILLNSLQSSVLNMAIMRNPAPASTSLIGGVTQAVGRRRRATKQ